MKWQRQKRNNSGTQSIKAKKEWLVCRAQLYYGTKTKEGTTLSM